MTAGVDAERGIAPQPPVTTRRGSAALLLASAASVALHAALVAAVLRLPPERVEPRATAVSIEVVEQPPAPPPPAPRAAPEPRRAIRPSSPAPRAPPVTARAPTAAPRTASPPPPTPTAQEERKPGPIRFGVSMSSTTAAGTTAAPVGNTVQGSPPPRATEPAEARGYRSDRYAPATEVSALPVPIRVDVPRSEYPPDALREGFEGAVRLRLVVGEDGTVRDATVLNDPGHGLGAAAARAARRWFRFRPALKDGQPVATEIPFTVEFQLQ